jgi:hypothetical protein
MMDLKNPKWMYAKAVMFILIGAISFALVLAEFPSIKVAALLLLMIWGFSRAYYFTFYVIEKYVDPENARIADAALGRASARRREQSLDEKRK